MKLRHLLERHPKPGMHRGIMVNFEYEDKETKDEDAYYVPMTAYVDVHFEPEASDSPSNYEPEIKTVEHQKSGKPVIGDLLTKVLKQQGKWIEQKAIDKVE